MLSFGLLISIWCIGLTLLTEKGWPLFFVTQLEERYELYRYTLWKPLFGCVYCMSSVHGVLLYALVIPFPLHFLPVSIVVAFAVTRIAYPQIIKLLDAENNL